MTPFKRILSYFTPVKKGTDASPDPEGLGRSAYRDLTKHGSNVNSDHLPFSQALGTFGVYDRPPPPGSIVVGIPANQADGYIFPHGFLWHCAERDRHVHPQPDHGVWDLDFPNLCAESHDKFCADVM
jgi:hypothetical protein